MPFFNELRLFVEPPKEANAGAPAAPGGAGAFQQACKACVWGTYKHLGLMRLHEAVRARMRPRHMTILLFHRVTDVVAPDGLTVGTRWFRDFCRLMKSDYQVVTLGDIQRTLKEGKAPRRRTVAITFDDCYADNLDAARLLHEHGLPATFFIPTQYVGTPLRFPWDGHLPPLPNLTWNDLQQMAAWGHDIGSHAVSHADFGMLNDDQARRELVESRAVLEENLDRPVKWFAFPFGGRASFRAEHVSLVADAGYDGCVSAVNGHVEMDMIGQVLPRQAVPYFHNLTQLELHINRCSDLMSWLKRRIGLGGRTSVNETERAL